MYALADTLPVDTPNTRPPDTWTAVLSRFVSTPVDHVPSPLRRMNPELTRVSAGAENVESADSEIVGRASTPPRDVNEVFVRVVSVGAETLALAPTPMNVRLAETRAGKFWMAAWAMLN